MPRRFSARVVLGASAAIALTLLATGLLLRPRYRSVRLPSGRTLEMTDPPPRLQPVGASATLLPYVTHTVDDEALAQEVEGELLPLLAANAEQAGDTIILIQARRPRVNVGVLAYLTEDTYLRYDRRDGRWQNVAFRVPGR